MTKTRSCNVLCQCERCRDQVEMTGTRFNGTLNLDKNSRVGMQGQNLVDSRCGGLLHLFSMNPRDQGYLNIIYGRKIRGARKIILKFKPKT